MTLVLSPSHDSQPTILAIGSGTLSKAMSRSPAAMQHSPSSELRLSVLLFRSLMALASDWL